MIEAETLVVHGRVYYDAKLPASWGDGYYKTVITPGFSDGHMHPQVIDPGFDGVESFINSYDWIERRVMAIDEASIRNDEELARKLAYTTYLRSLMEGVTLVAVTGAIIPNVMAWNDLEGKPRTVFLPTTMRRKGWMKPWEIVGIGRRLENSINDLMARLGIFVHSLRYSTPDDFRFSYNSAEKNRWILGMHLSEGVSEVGVLKEIMGRSFLNRIVSVHCLNDIVKEYGLSCVSCPGTNLLLYNRFKPELIDIDAYGSDWPHIIGTVPTHLQLITRLYKAPIESLLFKLTTGGYLVYGIPSQGDLVAYDEKIEDIISRGGLPKSVFIGGKQVVNEGEVVDGYNYDELNKMENSLIDEAYDLYNTGFITKGTLFSRIKKMKELLNSARVSSEVVIRG